jgi:hypothetical protein
VRAIGVEERRARLSRRQLGALDVDALAGDLVGLHSSDPATVFLSAWARVDGFAVDDLEAALYDRRSLVRMLGMRRTMFVVPVDLAAVMDAACTKALGRPERKRLVGMVEDQRLAKDGARWVRRAERQTLDALAARREATAAELAEDVPALRKKLRFGEGKRWAGEMGIGSRILYLLATEGRVVRGRPLGTWLSSQYRWAAVDAWLPGGLPDLDPDEARVELARRWLWAFGPGTVADLRWWTGWPLGQTKQALARVGTVEVDLDGSVGHLLAEDQEAVEPPPPSAALLPALDPTVMGWKERGWYLGEHQAQLFDANGNAGPTVWWEGRVVGGWAQAADGEVVVRLLEDVGGEAEGRVAAEAARLTAWLDGVRVAPRFATPLQRELAAGS